MPASWFQASLCSRCSTQRAQRQTEPRDDKTNTKNNSDETRPNKAKTRRFASAAETGEQTEPSVVVMRRSAGLKEDETLAKEDFLLVCVYRISFAFHEEKSKLDRLACKRVSRCGTGPKADQEASSDWPRRHCHMSNCEGVSLH